MSWFSTGLDTLNQLTEKAKSAAESVQNAIPAEHKELLAKLTLNTEEMKATRQQFGEDATRKEQVKDMLAGIFPWETRDSEREILVEECKEAILALSGLDETFFGPYEMPALNVKVEGEEEDGDVENEVEGEEEVDEDKDDEGAVRKVSKPSPESLAKLAKLEPLPPLLHEFDLDSHVGLIQRLLKVDPNLVAKQSSLSGGGPRERVFWHNYFFWCAYTRYEAGLSIDEIWSFNPEESHEEISQATGEETDISGAEETVVFDQRGEKEQTSEATAFAEDTSSEIEEVVGVENSFTAPPPSSDNSPSVSAGTSEYELVEDGLEGGGDPELNELEAEIARELED